MLTKVCILKGGEPVIVSNYAYLKYGISSGAKHILEIIIDNIVTLTERYIKEISKPSVTPESSFHIKGDLQSQTSLLYLVLNHYPNLNVFVMSYELKDKYNFSKEYSPLMPQWKSPETFLSFFVKFVSYIGSFMTPYPLEIIVLTERSSTFVEYEGSPILLSFYNELLIFREIIKVLENTLLTPDDLFKSLYSFGTWKILSQFSCHLLDLPFKGTLRNYKAQIITELELLCLRALKVHEDNCKLHHMRLGNETQTVYLFLHGLSSIERRIKSHNKYYLSPEDHKDPSQAQVHFNKLLLSHKKVHYLQSLIKEQSYFSNPFSLITQDPTNKISSKNLIDLSNDKIILEGYTPKLEPVTTDKLLSKINSLKYSSYV